MNVYSANDSWLMVLNLHWTKKNIIIIKFSTLQVINAQDTVTSRGLLSYDLIIVTNL